MLSVIHKVYPDISNINICTPLMTFPLLKLSHYMKKWPLEAKDSDYPSKFHLMADTLEVKWKKKTKASSFLTVPNNYTSSNYQVSIASILKQVESKLFLATLPYSRIQDGLTLLVGNVSVCGIKLLLSLLNSLFHWFKWPWEKSKLISCFMSF